MRMLPLILLLTSAGAFASQDKICIADLKTRSLVSEWAEGDSAINILTSVHGLEISRERGRIAYQDDLNGDGDGDGDGDTDYIVESFDSEGSAKDRIHGIYIQRKGFLKFVGGDYLAGVRGVKVNSDALKDIVFLSCQRNESNKIIYKNGEALTKTHVWSFNPSTGRYEGEMD